MKKKLILTIKKTNIMKNLTYKQKQLISKHNITVEQEALTGDYVYLIAGTHNQQKGCKTEYDAFCAGIEKVIKG